VCQRREREEGSRESEVCGSCSRVIIDRSIDIRFLRQNASV
jgi:hypothetical protein